MKKFFLVLVMLCVSAFAEFETININESIVNNPNIQIFDIRTQNEWKQTGILKGADLVTYLNADGSVNPNFVQEVKAKIDPNKKVAIICKSGARSKKASTLLDQNGIKVINLNGGMNAVINQKIPTIQP